MEEFIFFHDHSILFLLFFVRIVGYIVIVVMVNKFSHTLLLQNQFLEASWTIVPIGCLVQIALPSLLLLYVIEEFADCRLSIKSTGHQWYWSYEYSNFKFFDYEDGFEFDSYIIPTEQLEVGDFRLLDVDNRAILPFFTHIQVLITRTDVIHSWAIPSIGVKADACPGRINQLSFIRNRAGVFYGQCSEICGANHRFIPIVVELVRRDDYVSWFFSTWAEKIYEDD